jgi:hypothetical protein
MNNSTVESFRLEVSRYEHVTNFGNETRAKSTFTDILRARESTSISNISEVQQEKSWTTNTFMHRLILNHDFYQHTFQGTIMRALLGDRFSSRIGLDTELNEILIGIGKAFNKEISDHCGAIHYRLEILGMLGNKNSDGSIFLGNITNNTIKNTINPVINSIRKLIDMYENKGEFPYINIKIDVDQSYVDIALQDTDIAFHIKQLHLKLDRYLPPTQESLLSSALEDLAYTTFDAESFLAVPNNQISAEISTELERLIRLAKVGESDMAMITTLSKNIKAILLQIQS